MLSILRLLYVLALPVAGCFVLARRNESIPIGSALFVAVGIFIYHYLQAALISTERLSAHQTKDLAFGITPVLLVGWSASFSWQEWIVEQMFLEAAAFSLSVAMIAVFKGTQEGRKAPWAFIGIIFVLPALTLVFIAGRAVLKFSETSFHWDAANVALLFAMGIAVFDTVSRLHPYIIGNEQLDEPIQHGWQIALTVIWIVGLLVGIPLLLTNSGA